MNYHALETPCRWRAGLLGDKPFYFNCADCGAHEPVIAGLIAPRGFDGSIASVAMLGSLKEMAHDKPGLRPAIFCAPCLAERLAGRPARAWNPPPPESWPHLKHHDILGKSLAFRRCMIDEQFGPFRSAHEFRAELERRVARVIQRHLENGGSVIEARRTEWRVSIHRAAEETAAHVANRVVGFGWSLALNKAA